VFVCRQELGPQVLSTVRLGRAGLDLKLVVKQEGVPMDKVVDSTAIKEDEKVSLDL
jgi:hypothetical protein